MMQVETEGLVTSAMEGASAGHAQSSVQAHEDRQELLAVHQQQQSNAHGEANMSNPTLPSSQLQQHPILNTSGGHAGQPFAQHHALQQGMQAHNMIATPQGQVVQVPLMGTQQALLVSSTTGAVLGIQPIATDAQPNQHHHQRQLQQTTGAPIIHNLIPEHLQSISLAPSLSGTPGYQPALILPQLQVAAIANSLLLANGRDILQTVAPISRPLALPQPQQPQQSVGLTVQDRSSYIPPVYNGVNMSYPGVRQVHAHPPVFVVDNFLTPFECDFLIHAANDAWSPAPVVGKGAGEISPSRTSSTCYLAREDLPDYMRKVSLLTSKPIDHCELPQVGRYLPSQQYLHHFDAFDLSNEDGRRFASNGGQRIVTVLVYLNDCAQGGQTQFPALNLQVSPRRGTALVFFPSTVDGYLDKMALHAALPAVDTKYVSQVWIRQGNYSGQPSKRLENTLGVPFDAAEQVSLLLGLKSPV